MSKCLTLAIILVFLFTLSGCGNPKPFNIGQFENKPTKVSKRFIKSKGVENIKSSAFKKVVIIEFNVEFLINMHRSEYISLTDTMYQMFTKSLENIINWKVINKNKVANDPIYKQLIKKQWGQRRYGKKSNTIVSSIYPTSKLALISSGKGNLVSNYLKRNNKWGEAGILEGVGASAALKVHTVVDYFYERGNGRIIIVPTSNSVPNGSKVNVLIGYLKTPSPGMGYKALDGKEYIYAYKKQCSFVLKYPLVSYTSWPSLKETFEIEDFTDQLKDIYSVYAEMLAIEISKL